jgi:hypothetical protein
MKSHAQSRQSHRRQARPLTVAQAGGALRAARTTGRGSQSVNRESQLSFPHRSSPVTRHCPLQSQAKHNRKSSQSTEKKHHQPKSIASFCRLTPELRSPAPAITARHVRLATYATPITHFLIDTAAIRNLRNSQKRNNRVNSNRQHSVPSACEQNCFDPSPFAAIIVPLTHCELSRSAPSGLRKP